MGILDGIVEWIAEQVMNGLDLVTTSVLGALGCDMAVFLRYFPAAETMYKVFVALAIGIILLNWVWQLFKNFGLGIGIEAEDPVDLSIRSVLFILLAYFSDVIVDTILKIGGTPYGGHFLRHVPCGPVHPTGRALHYRAGRGRHFLVQAVRTGRRGKNPLHGGGRLHRL